MLQSEVKKWSSGTIPKTAPIYSAGKDFKQYCNYVQIVIEKYGFLSKWKENLSREMPLSREIKRTK